MKYAKHLVFSALLLLSAAVPAAAQDAYGKFAVNHATRWGGAVLPAGSYNVVLRTGPAPFVIITSDARNSVSIMAVAQYLETPQCRSSSLELEQNGSAWDVRSLCFASSVEVHFAPTEKTENMNHADGGQVASLNKSD